MPELKPAHVALHDASKVASRFLRPTNCAMEECSAIVMYEHELARHDATIARLQLSALREADLLRQKEDLLQYTEVLAKEAAHRLLNGLQLIKTVLALQSRNAENAEVAAQLSLAAQRISTLARIHQHLQAVDKLETVEFKQYLETLCQDLSDLVPGDTAQRTLRVEGDDLTISRAIATPLAYIANEIITNSIKYAKGTISVTLQQMPNGDVVLSVVDDGPGLPESFDPAVTKGLGMQIITTLASQIHGKLSFGKGDNDAGARFLVRFNPQA